MVNLQILLVSKTNQKPLPWVSVEVDNLRTSTDTSGRATFDIAAGAHTLKVRTISYQPFTGTITVPAAGGAFKIELNPALM